GVIANILYISGFDSNSILVIPLIFFSAFTVTQVFMLTKKKHSIIAGVAASFFCAVSFAQLNTFFLMYYKNIIAVMLLLSLFFFSYNIEQRRNLIAAIILNSAIGFLHKPTFLLSSVLILLYAIVNFKKEKVWKNSVAVVIVSTVAILLFYLPVAKELIDSLLLPALAKHTSGTFIKTDEYLSLAAPLLPFAVFGVIIELFDLKKKKVKLHSVDILTIFFLLSAFMVFSKMLFFRRFIVFLDLASVCFAGIGLVKISQIIYSYKKELVVVVLPILLASLLLAVNAATTAKPLINETQLSAIKAVDNFTESNATVIAATNYVAPWLLGYTDRNIIAPGLFENNKWDFNTWKRFWLAEESSEVIPLMQQYKKPLYVFILNDETSSYINREKFEDRCFEKIFNMEGGILYKFLC
ncbi:MAG: hypothetical protein J7L14_02790, partial [Candidatus Diapherotrites archaeon]|nr:hypothetical protein [Candidatus Diapherotrites archaeon]